VFDFKRDNGAWAFGVIWAGIFLLIDVFIARGLIEAARSEWFATTPGVVTKSDIKRGGRGSVRFEVEYTYTVNGQQFTGTKYDMQPHFVGNAYFYAARDAHPVGTPVTVHYDPNDPATAYLAPGFRSDWLFVAWWLTPFNLVGIGFLWAGWWHLTKRRGFDPALRRCVRRTQDGWLARPDADTRWALSSFAVLLIVTFFGCFLCGAYVMTFDFPPPWWLPVLMWTFAIVVSVLAGRWDSRRWLLHLNELEGTVSFTHNHEPVTISLNVILGVDLITEIRKPKGSSYEVVVISLRWRDKFDQTQTTKLAEYADAGDAVALVAWLSGHLGRPAVAQLAV